MKRRFSLIQVVSRQDLFFKAIKEQKAKVLFISPEALLENPGFAEGY